MLPQLYNEYYAMGRQYDSTWVPGRRMVNEWHHQSEGNMAFYHFDLADPTVPEHVKRARRFAHMYTGEDPEAPNWDLVHKIIRSPFPTSRGPVFEVAIENVMAYFHGSRVVDKDNYRCKPMGTMATLYPVIKELGRGLVEKSRPRRPDAPGHHSGRRLWRTPIYRGAPAKRRCNQRGAGRRQIR